jgi:hypothetical protein
MIEDGQNTSAQVVFIHTRNAVTIAQDKEDFIVEVQIQVCVEAFVSERRSDDPTPDVVIIFD